MCNTARLGDYVLESQLGAGARSVLYRARDRRDGRIVALKVGGGRAEHEWRAGQRLCHRHIVGVIGAGMEGGRDWLALELVDGLSLRARLDAGAAIDLDWIVQLLDALCHVHAQGIVHADIKPANLLIGSDGKLKLGDFGLAVIDGEPGARSVGTPHYMPPEQLRGQPLDARTDLFAVGVILYELLTGLRPFAGMPFEVMQKVLHDDPIAPSQLHSTLGCRYDDLLSVALAKLPSKRFENAQAFRDAFCALR